MSETVKMEDLPRGNLKASMKVAGKDGSAASSSELWNVDPRTLHVMPNFNRRQRTPEYLDHIQRLKTSIVENGYMRDKPIAFVTMEVDGKPINYITDGHSRHEAVMLAIKEGLELETITAVSKPRGTSVEDLKIETVKANEGRGFTPYEVALVIKDLQDLGLDEKTIARRLDYSTVQIKNLLAVLDAPKAVRDMVASGKVAATTAVNTVKKHGAGAAARLKEGLKAAEASGKTKVSGKHMKKLPTVKVKGVIGTVQTTGVIHRLTIVIEGDALDLLADDTVELKLVKRNNEEI